MLRTHTCGELRREHVGQDVRLCGWVDTTRKHANLTFVMVRDRYGFVQVTVGAGVAGAEVISKEAVVLVSGRVNRRPGGTEHPQLPTGEIEVEAVSIELLGACRPLPFEIRDDVSVRDDLRLEYRFLDIRRPLMLGRLVERHRIVTQLRRSLDEMNFLEVEPPMFVKSTPEGSRDFIVPSRLYPGRFYALPQSPQLYKQILMIAGVDRYYSIPRCFRDEDPRRGRQLVHTQIDLEMSFVEEDDVFSVVEKFLRDAFANVLGVELPVPFPRFTYDEVIARWGIDKPDLRFGMELVNLSGPAQAFNYDIFRRALDSGGVVKGIVAPGCASYSRKEIDGLEEFVKRYRAAGLSWIKVEEGGVRASFGHHAQPHEVATLVSAAGAEVGDLVLIVADQPAPAARALGELRNHLGIKLDLIQRGIYRPLWVREFPMFEWDDEAGRWAPMHHMFTMPKPEHLEFLETRPADVRAHLYDVVLNGVELGSGSIRITNPALQQRIMEFVGYSREAAEENFGFLLRAYEFGAPPHAGIALGLDNLVMTMLDLTNLTDVIAFPNNSAGVFPLDGSPSVVDREQLEDCHIRIARS